MNHAVAHSESSPIGFTGLVKGAVYYPLQWAAGLAAAFTLGVFQGAPPGFFHKVAAVRASGIGANIAAPIHAGIAFKKTPSENLYEGKLLSYGIQRPLYALTMSLWPVVIAVGLTIAMPYIAPAVIGIGHTLTAAGVSVGANLASLSGAQALGAHALSGAASLMGSYLQALPAAFAMPEGITFAGMVMATSSKVFQITLVAAIFTDLLNLEQWNPKHKVLNAKEGKGW